MYWPSGRPPVERIKWLQAPLAAARRSKDRHTETSLLGHAGTAYCHMGETQHAIKYHMQALTLAREIGERKKEEDALRGLGLAYAGKDNFRTPSSTTKNSWPWHANSLTGAARWNA